MDKIPSARLTIIPTLSLIPGPSVVDYIMDSQQIQEIAEYKVFDVIEHLCSLENVTLLQNGGNDAFNWKFRWQKEQRFIEIGMTTMDGLPDSIWGGSELKCHCAKDDVLDLWLGVKSKFENTWFHDGNCTIYSLEAFQQADF
jgi:hypothetical protein